ncbi:MAG TPA: response regulator [Candidatus Paceibacterota bacterium]|nr:response regulator [Candidatus Paceibacterota bacterium]
MTERKRVLVVDDDGHWRRHVSQTVETAGHTPITAKDEVEAIQLLRNDSFDLIVTDNSMLARNSGVSLLMRQNLRGSDTPAILHTSEVDKEQEQVLREDLPNVELVIKSYGSDTELREAIEKLLPRAA